MITDIELTGGATAVTMMPTGRSLRPGAGQFGLFRFEVAPGSERHPFSFSEIGPEGQLRITVKALGDFTSRIGAQLERGQHVTVQGPFGRFRPGGAGRQVWIAGGIGITPFVAAARTRDPAAGQVDLFYCVRSRADAPHLQELEQIAAKTPNLRLHLVASAEGRRLTAQHIAETVGPDLARSCVSFCGPNGLRRALQEGLRAHGVSRRRFHYEEFEFRSGIGLTRLARWLIARLLQVTVRRRAARSRA